MGILENTYTLTILSALVYLKYFMQRRVILEYGLSGKLSWLNFGCWKGDFYGIGPLTNALDVPTRVFRIKDLAVGCFDGYHSLDLKSEIIELDI